MKRLAISMMFVGLALGAGLNTASAAPSAIATSMGDLRWGQSEREVTSFAKRDLGEQYNQQIAKTKDAGKQAQLKSKLKQAQSEVDGSLTSFEGGHSRWDNSPVAGEFSYGNSESMLVAKGAEADSYYFFVDGKLWKFIKVVDKRAAGGGDFKKFSQSLEDKFGKGRPKTGELSSTSGNTQWVEYLDRNSRLRVADDNAKRGGFALIYEEMAAVREQAKLHPPKKAAPVADEPAPEPPANQIAKAPTKRSMFGNENRNEDESQYQSRKEKAAAEARDRGQREQARKVEAKKGEALKQLDGMNDSDPLGGL